MKDTAGLRAFRRKLRKTWGLARSQQTVTLAWRSEVYNRITSTKMNINTTTMTAIMTTIMTAINLAVLFFLLCTKNQDAFGRGADQPLKVVFTMHCVLRLHALHC